MSHETPHGARCACIDCWRRAEAAELARAKPIGEEKTFRPVEPAKNQQARATLEQAAEPYTLIDRADLKVQFAPYQGSPAPPEPVRLSIPLIDAPGELRFMAALSWLAREFQSIPGSPVQHSEALPPDQFERAIRWFASKYAPERPF